MKQKYTPEQYVLFLAIGLLIVGGVISSGIAGVSWQSIEQQLPKISLPFGTKSPTISLPSGTVRVETEESVVINVVDKASPSVVTVSIKQSPRTQGYYQFDPFNPFGGLRRQQSPQQPVQQDIGSGFIVSADGLIVTNKHVVEDSQATYQVITKDDTSYNVDKIYRDPANDLAILKITAANLTPVEMGDSSKIKVGQTAIAIGTALGEFRQTVTTGVVSGIGRGITAGGPFESSVERLDNVIQTSAAINPGNSGGPLFNSSGQVIGVNTAVSQEGQNIGFAIPINVIKDSLSNFNSTGQFNRPFLGIRYRTVSKDVAILNDVPEGAYILEVVAGTPAEKAGLENGDIVTKVDQVRLTGDNAELSKVLATHKVGDTLTLTVWRDNKEITVKATLGNQSG
jgi:serine protease Do